MAHGFMNAFRAFFKREFAPIDYGDVGDAGIELYEHDLTSERLAKLDAAEAGVALIQPGKSTADTAHRSGAKYSARAPVAGNTGCSDVHAGGSRSAQCENASAAYNSGGQFMRTGDSQSAQDVNITFAKDADRQYVRSADCQTTRTTAAVRQSNTAETRQDNASSTKHGRERVPLIARGSFVSVHPALLGLVVLALLLGQGQLMALTVAALAVHELAHILCARALGVPLNRLRLTPLGAALELDPRLMTPRQEALIAGAGPLASVVTVGVLCLLIGHGLNDALLRDAAGIALALALFNLMPASPLDGGRLLHAYARGRLGERRAGDVCGALGMGLAVLLMVGVLLSAFSGVIPLMLMAASISMFTLAASEFLGDAQTAWQLAWRHCDELGRGACLPVRVIAVDGSTPARALLGKLRRGATTVFRVTDDRMRCLGEIGEAELISRCVDSPDAEIRRLVATSGR